MMHHSEPNRTRIVAVCGKGGAGKTCLSAAIIKILLDGGAGRVLAIDADPAIGLATALEFKARKTVDDIRNDLIKQLQNGNRGGREEIVHQLDYAVFDAIEERNNLAFLAIGRPEDDGCYCQVNEILKDIIGSIADNFDYVVIDGEAGIEQINRRVMEKVSHLILVSDPSVKGIEVAKTIKDVSRRRMNYERIGLIINRIRDDDEKRLFTPHGFNILGVVPEDDTIRHFDIEGRSLLKLPDCPALTAMRGCLSGMDLLPDAHTPRREPS
jgi:CO dehydrogenase maturation factor